MIEAQLFLQAAQAAGIRLYTGVPCSYLKPFINTVIDAPELAYIGATNEGDAVAIATGARLAGVGACVMFQNSGFGNAVSPLTSLNAIFKLPVLVLTTWRGEPGGAADEPQHDMMGAITPGLFELMGIPWELFPEEPEAVGPVLDRAVAHMEATGTCYGLIMRKDAVAPHKLLSQPEPRPLAHTIGPAAWSDTRPSRQDVLTALQRTAGATDALLATTGFTGRALYALDDRASQFYMVGSMGCVGSLALGLAWAEPERRVIAIDGDGAALMRLGAFATIGHEQPANLVHVLLDNEVHDSTGGQSTVSHTTDLAAVAWGCGYARVVRAATVAELEAALTAPASGGSLFVHIKTQPGERGDLPRPTVTPVEVAKRFGQWLKATTRQTAGATR